MKDFRNIRLLMLLLLLNLSTSLAYTQKKKIVFLLAGQSNMDGRAKANELSDKDKLRLKKAQKNVTLFYNFKEGKPLDSTKAAAHTAKKFGAEYLFGPELFFGIEMSEHYPDRQIILIKRARGGMSLYGAWNPDWSLEKAKEIKEENQPKLYDEFIDYSKKVLNKLDKDSYQLCGMLWVQGVSDSGKKGGIRPRMVYEKNLRNLIKSVRKDFKQPNLPFLLFEEGFGKVPQAMRKVANTDENVVLIPQKREVNSKFYFERNPPPIGHYTAKSMKKIGTFFFEFYHENFRID